MNKNLVVIAGILALIVALSLAGFAFAQTQTPPQSNTPNSYGPGMMGGYGRGMMGSGYGRGTAQGGYGRGMMGYGGYGPIHDYMEAAVAKALGITQADLEAKQAAGETMYSIANAQGLSDAQINDLFDSAHSEALKAAVSAGAITQAQADWMEQHMDQMGAYGMGPGFCHGASQGQGN
jgi:hypothetical protein